MKKSLMAIALMFAVVLCATTLVACGGTTTYQIGKPTFTNSLGWSMDNADYRGYVTAFEIKIDDQAPINLGNPHPMALQIHIHPDYDPDDKTTLSKLIVDKTKNSYEVRVRALGKTDKNRVYATSEWSDPITIVRDIYEYSHPSHDMTKLPLIF